VILDPSLAVIVWAHYAPPIGDMFRKSYRKLLRWNDEFPFVKFSVGEDERPLLASELAIGAAGADSLGLAIARILDVADRLLDESKGWLWIGGIMPAEPADRPARNPGFLDRYADRLPAADDAQGSASDETGESASADPDVDDADADDAASGDSAG
jgi:Putative bacterial sensory transduction regulator